MSTPTVILSAFVVILSGAKDLGSSAWVSREGNCGGSSLAPLTQNDNVSAPSVILSAFIVILSEAKDLGSSLGSVKRTSAVDVAKRKEQTAGILIFKYLRRVFFCRIFGGTLFMRGRMKSLLCGEKRCPCQPDALETIPAI